MNTKQLKSQHSDVYKMFFGRNNLVFSLPLLLRWSGDIFRNYKGVSIRQKIPLRIYIGVKKIQEPVLKLNTLQNYDFNDQGFVENNLLESTPYFNTYKQYFQKKYKKQIEKTGGLEINFLSEVPMGVGMSSSSIVMLLFFIAFESVYNNKKYLGLSENPINDYLNLDTDIDDLLRKAIHLSKKLDMKVRVNTHISTFFDSTYPILSFTEDIDNQLNNINIKNIRFFGYRINDIDTNLPNVPFLPVDYSIIYSGLPVIIENIADSGTSLGWAGEIKKKGKKYFSNDIEQSLPGRKPTFYKEYIDQKSNMIKKSYGTIMGSISLEMLNVMLQIYGNQYTESTTSLFIRVVNKVRHGNYISSKSSDTFTRFLNRLSGTLFSATDNAGIMPNDTSIMGGCAVCVIPLEGYRKNILDIVGNIQSSFTGAANIYCNWIDGIEKHGFKEEQNLYAGKYSEFIGENNIVITSNKGDSVICKISEININIPDGLTLDMVNRKIYIDGVKLTSKDIHSQSTTIDILSVLIQNIGDEISNKSLPVSSYTRNKNEMIGKIVLPLVKVIEKNMGEQFPFICKGSLDNFYICLGNTEVKINIIKSLG